MRVSKERWHSGPELLGQAYLVEELCDRGVLRRRKRVLWAESPLKRCAAGIVGDKLLTVDDDAGRARADVFPMNEAVGDDLADDDIARAYGLSVFKVKAVG